jgi:hypothetical protein
MVRWKLAALLFGAALVCAPIVAHAQAYRLGPTFSLGGTTSPVELPDIAYDSNNNRYLQVAGKVFIEAHLLDANGNVLRTFNVVESGLYAQNPRVAFSPDVPGGGGYLVTWHATVSPGDYGRVHGRIYNANGDPVTGEFVISTNATFVQVSSQWTMGAPAAYSTVSREFLVVWGGNKYTTADIFGARIGNDGTILGGPFLISGGGADLYDRDPSVAYSPVSNKFLVGWGVYHEAGRFGYASARTVTAGTGNLGNVIDLGNALGVSITSVAYNPTHDQFLFAWHNQSPASPRTHYGQVFDSNGSPLGGIKVVSAYYGSYDALDVEFNTHAGEYLLVTHGINHEDAAVTLAVDGTPYDNGFLVTSTEGVNGNFNPRMATSTAEKKWLMVTASHFAHVAAQFVSSHGGAGGAPPGSPPPPSNPPPDCSHTFSATGDVFGALGGGGGFTITTGDSCGWNLSTNAAWVTLSGSSQSGTGTKTISFSVAPNPTNSVRTALIYSDSRSYTVTQWGQATRIMDVNGDGMNDLFWQNSATGEISVWRMHGINIVSGDYLQPANIGDTAWKIMGTLDADRDGQTDLVLQHDAGYVTIWRMAGHSLVSSVAVNASVTSDPRWRIVGTGDVNRDGWDDLLWQHEDGTVAVWYMNGFSMMSGEALYGVSDPGWRVAGVGDFNQDGHVDLLWRHNVWGQLAIWNLVYGRYDGNGPLTMAVPNMEWQVAAVADFSGDGSPDLIWRNYVTGELDAWFLQGGAFVSGWHLNPSLVTDTNWRIVGPR